MPHGVYPRTEKHKEIARKSLAKYMVLGGKLSESHKAKIKKWVLNTFATTNAAEKISMALKGKPKSPEHIAKVTKANIGKFVSDETRYKLSISHLGIIPSKETRLRLSKSIKLAYTEGRTFCRISEESRRKSSETLRKRIDI